METPAQSLILEYLQPKKDARILILEGGDGYFGAEAAQRVSDGKVLSLSRDVRDVWAAQARLEPISNATATLDVFPNSNEWDLVLLNIPKERRYARTLLLAAWECLKPGGKLLLAGPTQKGAKAVITDAQRLFENATVLGYRNHQRVAACTRGKFLPDPLPKAFQEFGIAPGTTHTLEVNRPEGTLKFHTHPGIFSWKNLDEGTELLLRHLEIRSGSRVWDVGCGYGVIGLAAALAGAEYVAMSDINLIGIDYARNNAARNHVENKVDVFPTDGIQIQPAQHTPERVRPFDRIVSNPAFHQGHEVNKSMADELIAHAKEILSPQGELVIVANRFLNYDRHMEKYFEKVTRIAETNKFHVIQASLSQ